jgi:iron(II)-dependent oxidoreductase
VTPDRRPIDLVRVPGGLATIGDDGPAALDNERPMHRVAIEEFRLARSPVSEAQFAAFMDDGGYRRAALWTEAGWAWRAQAGIDRPQHWRGRGDAPVCGVGAHEADAFCRWAGLRLPNEFEWEHAVRAGVVSPSAASAGAGPNSRGRVWEWTASPFAPYPGFRPWPYAGYSETWFDGCHRVLRGGSAATRGCALRPSFRNWYHPETRLIFAGFRCAQDLA